MRTILWNFVFAFLGWVCWFFKFDFGFGFFFGLIALNYIFQRISDKNI